MFTQLTLPWDSRTITAMEQLILPLYTKPLFRFDNLVVHQGNETAVSTITSVYLKRDKVLPNLFLYGPGGTGKTHILQALAEALRQNISVTFISAHKMNQRDLKTKSDIPNDETKIIIQNDQPSSAIIIDDVHEIAAEAASALWNISNKLTTAGLPFIMSSLLSPQELFELNLHLRSRVTSGLVLRLENPDDPARVLILDKMARDRNIRLPPEVNRYLVNHKSRDLNDLARIIDRIDFLSLNRGRRITLPFLRELEKDGLL